MLEQEAFLVYPLRALIRVLSHWKLKEGDEPFLIQIPTRIEHLSEIIHRLEDILDEIVLIILWKEAERSSLQNDLYLLRRVVHRKVMLQSIEYSDVRIVIVPG